MTTLEANPAASRPAQSPGPRRPVRPAPAAFGKAGLSAGEGDRIRRSVALPPGRTPERGGASALARGLGWFSIALGAAELLGGRTVARTLGEEDHVGLVRLFGLREIATGVGILAQDTPRGRAPWVWARVAGDAIDLVALGAAANHKRCERSRVLESIAAVAAVTALDVACAVMLGRRR